MPDVQTRVLKPHPLLQPYIANFSIRKFDTRDEVFQKAMIANHEMTMVFFFHSNLHRFTQPNGTPIPFRTGKNGLGECCYTGILSDTKNYVGFFGPTTLINIHFSPVGFYYLFNIAPKDLAEKTADCEDILPGEILRLQEKLHDTADAFVAVSYLQQYLLEKLKQQKHKYQHEGVIRAARFLVNENGAYCIKKLAADCNMSLQNFEVQFKNRVGASPKHFSRLLRFSNAVNLKLYTPGISWKNVAYTAGFSDAVHLVKDFKEFTSLSPTEFMNRIHPPFENFIYSEE